MFDPFPLLPFTTFLLAIVIAFLFKAWLLTRRKRNAVGFFHPYTNDGGGGERVLWCSVRSIQEASPTANCVIFSGDDISSDQLRERALKRFGVELLRPIQVIYLEKRIFVEASSYPRLTLIGQSLGSIILAIEALTKFSPALFIDTSGYAFTYPVAYLFGCHVACYTHYPTISCDMITRVQQRKSLYNNSGDIAKSGILSALKIFYYQIFAYLYGIFLNFSSVVIVNSTWTENHIRQISGRQKKVFKIYPPCNTENLKRLSLERNFENEFFLISLAQFRPEKAQHIQINAFSLALNKLSELYNQKSKITNMSKEEHENFQKKFRNLKLKFVGSCRNEKDEKICNDLKNISIQLGIESRVDFLVNVSYDELTSLLGTAFCGLHSMTDEHFGISIVEYMASGVIPIAHNSGGPKQDIITPFEGKEIGFLASNEEEYEEKIVKMVLMAEEERKQMANSARMSVERFSDDKFSMDFKLAISPLLKFL